MPTDTRTVPPAGRAVADRLFRIGRRLIVLTPLLVVACSKTAEPVLTVSVEETGGGIVRDAETWQVAAPSDSKPIPADAAHGWNHWRGPNRNGIASGATPPREWSDTRNLLWQADVPGRGHSSPIVFESAVYLTTAEENGELSVLSYSGDDGKLLWKTKILDGKLPPSGPKHHAKSSHASPTAVCDDKRVYCTFVSDDSLFAAALTFDGEIVWGPERVGSLDLDYGYGASPTLYLDFLILNGDHQGGGYLAALDRATGTVRWRVRRAAETNYASPLVANIAGKDQLIMAGQSQIASYDPINGKENWSVAGTTPATAITPVYDADKVIASGGYPGRQTIAVLADGSKTVLWKQDIKGYVPAGILSDGYYYGTSDDGILRCFVAKTGEEKWKGRLSGGDISSAMLLADGHLYVTNERGTTYVVRATPEKFDVVAENHLGDDMFSSAAIVGDRLFLRVGHGEGGNRKEKLYCLAKK